MTRIKQEQVKRRTVENVYCDICGAPTDDPVQLTDELHAHAECLEIVADAEPQPSVLLPTKSQQHNNDSPYADGAPTVRTAIKLLLFPLYATAVFSVWPVTGLWLADRQWIAGMNIEGDTPQDRYITGLGVCLLIWQPLLISLVIFIHNPQALVLSVVPALFAYLLCGLCIEHSYKNRY